MCVARLERNIATVMQIAFTAYADDCAVRGEIALRTDRLSDFLASTEEFDVERADFQALEDGRVLHAETAAILRDDLCVVIASGPRGRAERRLWTRQYPVRARIGPYTVLGYLHSPPTIDPFRTTNRRPIVALTACTLEYTEAGTTVRIESDAVLVNAAKIDRMETASEEDLRLAPGVDMPRLVDARSKDMTHSA